MRIQVVFIPPSLVAAAATPPPPWQRLDKHRNYRGNCRERMNIISYPCIICMANIFFVLHAHIHNDGSFSAHRRRNPSPSGDVRMTGWVVVEVLRNGIMVCTPTTTAT